MLIFKQSKSTVINSVPASPASSVSKNSIRSLTMAQSKRTNKTPNHQTLLSSQINAAERFRSLNYSSTRQYPLGDLRMVSPFRYHSLSHSSIPQVEAGSIVKKLFSDQLPSQDSLPPLEYGDSQDAHQLQNQELLDK